MNELHLFAGAGGGILGGILLGHTCICAVEIEPYCRKVLLQRQRDGILPKFPIWDDVRTFDGKPWRGKVDVVCGGFPCQDISMGANTKGKGKAEGIKGARSKLWSEFSRLVSEIRPRIVFVENSPMLVNRGLGIVLGNLASLGYDAQWGMFRGTDVGLAHHRQRIFIYAHTSQDKHFGNKVSIGGWSNSIRSKRILGKNEQEWMSWRDDMVSLGITERAGSYTEGRRIFYGVADCLDRMSAIGNGQVPAVVKLAWETLSCGN
jgi:DNA (cytosine-5)-methyltransferase 1